MAKINNNYFFFNSEIKNTEEQKRKKKDNEIQNAKKKNSLFRTILNDQIHQEISSDNPVKNKEEAVPGGDEKEKIASLLKEVGRQGIILKKSKKVEDLEEYKRLIQDLIQKILCYSEQIETKIIYNTRRKEKISKLHLKVLDNELLDLTRVFMEEQKDVLKIASKIDKIEGILLDLIS